MPVSGDSRRIEPRTVLTVVLCVFALMTFAATAAAAVDGRRELIERQVARKGYRVDLSTQEWVIGGNGHELSIVQNISYTIINRQGWNEVLPVVIPYGVDQKVEAVELTVAQNGGKPKKYGRQDFSDYPAYPGFILYSDNRALVYADLVQADSGKISLSFRVKDERPVLSLALPLQLSVPVARTALTVRAPEGWTIRTVWRNCPEEIRNESEGSTFRWSAADVEPFLEEPLSPPYGDIGRLLLLSCLPPKPDPGILAFDNWGDIAGWAAGLFSPRAGLTEEMTEAATLAVSTALTRLDTVRTLYDLVRERTRYVAIEIGIGGYQPHPAALTYEKKYGDCKDMALLLCSLLGSAGVEARPVLVRTRNLGRVWPEFPSPGQFNHCIAYVPVSRCAGTEAIPEALREGIFLDPTAKMCSFGNVPEMDRGTECLSLGAESGELRSIPPACLQPDIDVRSTRILLRPNGSADCTVLQRNFGSVNQNLRYRLQGMDAPAVQKFWSQRLNDSFPGAEFSRLDIGNKDDIDLPLEFNSSFSCRKMARAAGKLLLLPLVSWKTFAENPLDDSLRLGSLSLASLTDRVDTVMIEYPAGYAVTHFPESDSAGHSFAAFSCSVECREGNAIRVIRSIRFTPEEIPAGQYREVRDFIDRVLKKENESIVLESR